MQLSPTFLSLAIALGAASLAVDAAPVQVGGERDAHVVSFKPS